MGAGHILSGDLSLLSSFPTNSAMPSVASTATHLIPVLESPGPASATVSKISELTPRPVQQQLTLLQARRDGWRSSPWYRLPLSSVKFEDLCRHLARDTRWPSIRDARICSRQETNQKQTKPGETLRNPRVENYGISSKRVPIMRAWLDRTGI